MNRPDIYLVITIDTEADHSVDWKKSKPLTFKSITETIPAMLEPLFKEYGAIGTYLLTTEVLENDEAVSAMKTVKDCELGTHMHPEYIEPEKKYFDYPGTYSEEFSNNYGVEIEQKKLENITNLFKEKLGYQPIVYRGGKFGFGDNTALSLAGLGYLIDTSVTPRVSWRAIGGPDFSEFPDQPYFIKDKNGSDCLLEVPVSVIFLNSLSKFLNKPTWLRPSFSNATDMKRLINKYISSYSFADTIVLNMMFHSMEFCPMASPYSKNQNDCEVLIRKVRSVIEYCKEIKVKFCRLSQIKTVYESSLNNAS